MPSLCTLPRRTTALSRMRVLLLALLVVVPLVSAARPDAARASTNQYSIMMDDDLLLYRGPVVQEQALQRMKGLGVDYVRVTVLWSLAAENVRSTRARRKRFRAARPSTYPHRNWDRYDGLVRAAKRVGIGVLFNVTGPGPDFAHGKAPRSQRRNRRTWRPKAREFYKFVAAVGTRYSGSYADENQGRQALPRVSFWSLWNEPNQGGWLTPQYSFSRKLRRLIPASPRIYRSLYLFGRRALDRTGHGADVILVGETAPLGTHKMGSRTPIRPKKFMREMFCVRKSGAAFTGRASSARGCKDFARGQTIRAAAWAHHPYTKNLPPNQRDASSDSRDDGEHRRAAGVPRHDRRPHPPRRGRARRRVDGVRVRDESAGPLLRDRPGQAGRVPQRRGLPRLQEPAGIRADPVPAARRRAATRATGRTRRPTGSPTSPASSTSTTRRSPPPRPTCFRSSPSPSESTLRPIPP